MTDEQQAIAEKFGRAAFNRYRAGGVTLSQALDAAFDVVNPDKRVLVTAAIIASLVGVDISDRVLPERHRTAFLPENDGLNSTGK
jgi:hypothetical protein